MVDTNRWRTVENWPAVDLELRRVNLQVANLERQFEQLVELVDRVEAYSEGAGGFAVDTANRLQTLEQRLDYYQQAMADMFDLLQQHDAQMRNNQVAMAGMLDLLQQHDDQIRNAPRRGRRQL